MLGLLAVGYWSAVATLVNRQAPPIESVPVSLTRPPGPPKPMPQLRGHMLPPEPAWAPHPRPRAIGLAQGTPPVVLVDPTQESTKAPSRGRHR
jgi:hypothetical protein